MAPTGRRITATLEIIRGEALLKGVTRDENGVVSQTYAGETVYDWEGQTTVRRPRVGGITPETVYLDEDGCEWCESQLVPIAEAQQGNRPAGDPTDLVRGFG